MGVWGWIPWGSLDSLGVPWIPWGSLDSLGLLNLEPA